jgi:L-fuconolactonase
MTFGASRDDVEGRMMSAYLEQGLLARNPFDTVDAIGVGELVRLGVERGRATRPDLKIGVCGEHGGDAESIAVFAAAVYNSAILVDPSPGATFYYAPDIPPLDRAFTVADYCEQAEPNGIEAAVLVQVLSDLDETREFLAVAEVTPIVAGVVGWADLTAADVAETIASLRSAPGGDHLVGIRHLVQSEDDPGWLVRSDVLTGLTAIADAGLVFDLLVRPHQLPAAIRAVRSIEHLTVVLDHAAKPEIGSGPADPWSSLVAELATVERAYCKVSGLVTEAGPGWTAGEIQPFVDHLLHHFGPDRLLFGSDWPVSSAVATFAEVLDCARTSFSDLSGHERDGVFSTNTRRAYRLAPEAAETAR